VPHPKLVPFAVSCSRLVHSSFRSFSRLCPFPSVPIPSWFEIFRHHPPLIPDPSTYRQTPLRTLLYDDHQLWSVFPRRGVRPLDDSEDAKFPSSLTPPSPLHLLVTHVLASHVYGLTLGPVRLNGVLTCLVSIVVLRSSSLFLYVALLSSTCCDVMF
jgi:hypothetical protein